MHFRKLIFGCIFFNINEWNIGYKRDIDIVFNKIYTEFSMDEIPRFFIVRSSRLPVNTNNKILNIRKILTLSMKIITIAGIFKNQFECKPQSNMFIHWFRFWPKYKKLLLVFVNNVMWLLVMVAAWEPLHHFSPLFDKNRNGTQTTNKFISCHWRFVVAGPKTKVATAQCYPFYTFRFNIYNKATRPFVPYTLTKWITTLPKRKWPKTINYFENT